MKTRLTLLLVALLLAIGLTFACAGGDDDSGDDDDTEEPEAEDEIGPEGGEIEVTDPDSPLYRLKIEIPAGALSETTNIQIYVEENPPQTPAGFTHIGSAARFEPAGLKFNSPVFLHVPWSSPDQSLVVGHYNESSDSWIGLPMWGQDDEQRELALTDSFSIFGGFAFELNISVHTGFTPQTDGFPTINRSVIAEPDGSCWGFAIFANWYWQNRDQFPSDLAVSYSIPTNTSITIEAQEAQGGYDVLLSRLAQLFLNNLFPTDLSTLNTVVSNMLITNKPQVIILKEGWLSSEAHAVLAFGWQDNDLLIYDPNRPKQTNVIHWNGFNFDAYTSYDTFFSAELETFFTYDNMEDIQGDHSYDGPADCNACDQFTDYLYDYKGLNVEGWTKTEALNDCNSGSNAAMWTCIQDCLCDYVMEDPTSTRNDFLVCVGNCPDPGDDDDDDADDDVDDDIDDDIDDDADDDVDDDVDDDI